MADVGSYRRWWPWLLRLDAGDGLEPGQAWRCTVQPPLPYLLRFTIHLAAVDPPRSAAARVSGDIQGTATIEVVAGADGGSEVRLVSELAPANPFLRSVARFARPVARFGHDWVLDTGASQFRRRAFP
jgi:hypothetical protein